MNIFTCFSRIAFAVFLILMFTAPFAVAQVVDIPDANLRTIIEEFLNKNSGDAITVADMQTLTLFSAGNADIRDLTGLEHATNLIWLELDYNAISDLTPLIPLTQLAGLYLDNNPLSGESVDTHIPVLLGRGVDVSYTLPSDVNGDGMVNIQDLVSVTQHFGGAGDLTADVNGDGVVNITDLTQVAGDIGETTVDATTTDAMDTVDTVPGEQPLRTEAFIFRKFLEQMLTDLKATVLSFDYDPETIFQTPGKGFFRGGGHGAFYAFRHPNFRLLGIYVPDALAKTYIDQVNRFSAKYELTVEELIDLLRNLRLASIVVLPIGKHVPVFMPDRALREAVVSEINTLGVSLGPINRPKEPNDIIYQGEMWEIEYLRAEAVGIHSLIGLENATNLKKLLLGNVYGQDWDVIWVTVGEKGAEIEEYRISEPETPNRISDLKPLERLTTLEVLELQFNAVSDLNPLAELKNLKHLILMENKITHIFALADLTNLKYLSLANDYYSPQWAGNNDIGGLGPLRNLSNLERLDVGRNPIGGSIDVVRNFPKLRGLEIGCCGVSDLSPLVKGPGLRGAGSWVYLAHSPLTEHDVLRGAIPALSARGVHVEDGTGYKYVRNEDGGLTKVFANYVERCSWSYRESFRAAPALQLLTEPDVLSSLWHDLSQVPEETSLLPNYPNPFNPETWIPYQLAMPAEVTVAIHAADGKLVHTLSLGHRTAGVYKSKGRAAYWDGRNVQGEPVASGVYFYTLMAGDFTATRKLLIRK